MTRGLFETDLTMTDTVLLSAARVDIIIRSRWNNRVIFDRLPYGSP